jgi:transglutaminase-like putative cysteine protease
MTYNLGLSTTQLSTIPDGAAGTRHTLKVMRELVRAGKLDPEIRDLAQAIVADNAIPAKDWIGEIAALFHFVRAWIRYSLDINGVEVVQAPRETLARRYGDCDDMVVLIATLVETMGHAAVLCACAFDGIDYSHVVCLVSGANETELISLDATENEPMGWFPPGTTALMLAPIESD